MARHRGSRTRYRLSGVRPRLAQEAGLVERPDAAEQALAEGKNWKTDLSGGIIRVVIEHGCAPFGNGARPRHRLEFPRSGARASRAALTRRAGPRRDVPDLRRHGNVLAPSDAVQLGAARSTSTSDFPLIMTSGRLVEYEGGGDESRSNPLARRAAAEHVLRDQSRRTPTDRGVKEDDYIWVETPTGARMKMMAMITPAGPAGMVWMPFTSPVGGWARTCAPLSREGAPPVRGEAVNTAGPTATTP